MILYFSTNTGQFYTTEESAFANDARVCASGKTSTDLTGKSFSDWLKNFNKIREQYLKDLDKLREEFLTNMEKSIEEANS